MKMPRKARAAMNRVGAQDPEELKRRRKRFREMARAYKAEETVKNVKRTAKDLAKDAAIEGAGFLAGGLAGKALATGYKAYKAAKGAKKVAKGAQKMRAASRAKAAEKIKRSGPPVFKSRPITATDKAQRARVMTTGKAKRIIMNSKSSNSAEFKEAARFLRQQARRKKDAKKHKINVPGKPPAPHHTAARKKPAPHHTAARKKTAPKSYKHNRRN